MGSQEDYKTSATNLQRYIHQKYKTVEASIEFSAVLIKYLEKELTAFRKYRNIILVDISDLHSFNKYSLNIYYLLDTILCTGN